MTSHHEEKPATVLIVDDNPTNLGVLFDYLDDHRFNVLVAEDGESAIEQAAYAQPDIILLDVMMPGMDGFETCKHLRSSPQTKHIPIIFMTALTDATDKVKSFRVGAVDYVTKPFQHEEVLVRINNHLKIRRLQADLEARNRDLEAEIGQRKHAERVLQEHVTKLEESNAKLEESNAELDAFARTVAHDLRAPLTAVVGFAQLLTDSGELSDELALYAERIVKTGFKMSNITSELLLLARVRDADVILKPVAMAAIVASSRDRLAHVIEESSAALTIAGDIDAWPVGLGYGPWIEEVWVNYISNALKYGGEPPTIELGAHAPSGGFVRYWVRDNGDGITEDKQADLFTEFTRVDQTRPDGHGLGLSIVRRIIEKLGGQVGVDSQPGRGSTFYFALRVPDAATAPPDPPAR